MVFVPFILIAILHFNMLTNEALSGFPLVPFIYKRKPGIFIAILFKMNDGFKVMPVGLSLLCHLLLPV